MRSRVSASTIVVASGACLLVVLGAETVTGQAAAPSFGGCDRNPAVFHRCALEKAKTFRPPRTADGRPDLKGFWRRTMRSNDNIELRPATATTAAIPSHIVEPADGKIPYQPWALARRKELQGKYVDTHTLCYLQGVPRTMYYANIYRFLQPPGDRQIVVLLEEDHAYRVIPMDGRPHVGSTIKLWMGDSRGRWDGDTLAVEVTGQNNRHQLDRQWNFFSDSAHVVERYTMVDIDTIHYEATITDPEVFTRPWKLVHALARVKDLEPPEILEEACYEGERNWDTGLRGLYSLPDNSTPVPPGKPSLWRLR